MMQRPLNSHEITKSFKIKVVKSEKIVDTSFNLKQQINEDIDLLQPRLFILCGGTNELTNFSLSTAQTIQHEIQFLNESFSEFPKNNLKPHLFLNRCIRENMDSILS
jgi:hypothetical protein